MWVFGLIAGIVVIWALAYRGAGTGVWSIVDPQTT